MRKEISKYIWYAAVLFIAAALLGACGKEETEFIKTELDNLAWFETCNTDELPLFEGTAQRDSHWVYIYDDFVMEEGRFRFSQEQRVLEFCDWMTDEVYPLCIKLNCMHSDDSCNAYFEYKKGTPEFLYCDGQYLYYAYSGGIAETEWYRQNLDGSDRVKIVSLDEDLYGNRVVYSGQMVYFSTVVYEIDKSDSETTGEQTGIFKYHIYSANLNTGEVEPFACEFSGDIEDDLIGVELLGIYQDQLMIDYNVTTSMEPLDFCRRIFLYNISDGTMTGVASWDSSLNLATCPDAINDGIYAVLELDLKSEKHTGDHAYYEGNLNVFDLKTGIRYVLPKQKGLDYSLSYKDGKLFYSKANEQNVIVEAYDIETGEKITISRENSELIIDGEAGEWFYGRILSEENTFVSFHILKSDYYKGEQNLILEK